ncbi:MAG: glycoside hydrolase/phage tail family protein [Hyphomonadaceae bacterium]|nr:glycoside hydrolase/phage tail family protein [Hyphomonadaceae bacterium]
MTELVLSTVGRAIGASLPGVLGRIGATLGRVGGAMLGSAIDRQLFGVNTTREGARLTDFHLQASSEGASIPCVYGSVRIAGQVIWAARFKEHVETDETRTGGKGGGPRVTTRNYRYTLSFAVGLCEGEVARIGRVWANGAPLDLSTIAWRLHTGREDQAPDALIEAIEGSDDAPAYRGLAYIVFEDLPLEAFGNSIPQLSFEIVRPARGDGVGLEDRVKGVCLIPGAGEFVYATEAVFRRDGPGIEAPENVHAERERANLLVSLDQLEADFPNCETVMLVVAWFGSDLRCGECAIRPGVEIADKINTPFAWRVSGVGRAGAHLISTHDGGPAFGGTPCDRSVLQAIAELKRRGHKVGLYPFLMMDIASDAGLPHPSGVGVQPAYPWRGRISVLADADKTAAAGDQVEAFFGAATPGAFVSDGDGLPDYAGVEEWSYRRFILHNAKLAALAGGVDAFVLGSELRSLTTARDGAVSFPAVAALCSLAADVRALVGGATTLTYAADWSEYSGYRPDDGSGDVLFHLDPLWADANIDCVAIDWYPPLTDWREGDAHADAQLAGDIHDRTYLGSRIEAGENFDWFYANDADRASQTRTLIGDDAHGEAWIYRAKDVRSFWTNAHHDRPGGVRSATPTAWTPQSKPIWLMELGCAAIDKASNQPNVFVDPKSSETATPYFSSGERDDLIQRRVLDAYLEYWGGDANPVSSLTGAPMIEEIMVWAWDARPHPAFPARRDVWADGAVWSRGHWLNGRAGLSDLGEVVLSLCERAGAGAVNVAALRGAVSGYIVDSPATARAAIEPLMAAYDFSAAEREGQLVFFHGGRVCADLAASELTASSAGEAYAQRDAIDAPIEARVRFIDATRDYLLASVSARRLDRAQGGVASVDAPLVLEAGDAEALAQRVLADHRAAVEALSVDVGPARLALEPGDRVTLAGAGDVFEIARIEDAQARRLELRRVVHEGRTLSGGAEPGAPQLPQPAPTPAFAILDLPPLPGHETDDRPLAALFAQPWLGAHDIYAGASVSLRGSAVSPAIMGELLWPLYPGPVDRWDAGNVVRVAIYGGALASVTRDDVLNGANAFAIEAGGEWEIVQAAQCALIAPGVYELKDFLRGRQGSAHAMASPHAAGARIVKLDQRLARIGMSAHEWHEPVAFVAPPADGAASSNRAATEVRALAHAAVRPWAPAQVRAVRDASGDVALSWVRCAHIGGDGWGPGEPPLGLPAESYRLEVIVSGVPVRSETTSVPSFIYSAAAQTADFGSLPGSLHIRVAQLGESGATGLNAELTITL